MQVSSLSWAFQMAPVVKNSPANTEDVKDAGSIPGLGRFPGEGKGYLGDAEFSQLLLVCKAFDFSFIFE